MTSQCKADASRTNGLKSRGPTTAEGRMISSMNALKHGRRSKMKSLLIDDSHAYEERLRKWVASADPDDDVGEFLVHRYVALSVEIDHLERAQVEELTSRIESFEESELEAVHDLGKRLFFDPAGPTPMYGIRPDGRVKKKTSWNGLAVDPDDAAKLVEKLEASHYGCLWLKVRWSELAAQLEPGKFWQSHDRFKIIRLLRRQPIDGLEDRTIAEIFVASHALHPVGHGPFDDLLSDIGTAPLAVYRKAVKARWPDLVSGDDPVKCRQVLIDLVDENVERLDAKLEEHEANADVHAQRAFASLGVDKSPDGQRIRQHQMRCVNALYRGMETYRKYQGKKKAESGGRRAEDTWGRRRGKGGGRRTRRRRGGRWAEAAEDGGGRVGEGGGPRAAYRRRIGLGSAGEPLERRSYWLAHCGSW